GAGRALRHAAGEPHQLLTAFAKGRSAAFASTERSEKMAVLSAEGVDFDFEIPVVVIGAGACGLTAALAAHDAGQGVMILERDGNPRGSTSLSAGLIPAACTRLQREAGIDDSPEAFAADLVAKTH